MNLYELVKIASSEEKAEEFLRSRFKLYILPFEMAIILSYENKSA
jgi:hypothetical protein